MRIKLDEFDIKDVFKFRYFYDLEINKKSKYEFFKTKYINEIPEKVVSFNYLKTTKNIQDYYVHFFIDDYQFERVYNKIDVYYRVLSKAKGIISPDFSLYANMPKPLQVYQIYKKRLIEAYYSKKGVKVIPSITFSDWDSLDYVLDGLENIETIAVSTNGLRYIKELREEFTKKLLYIIDKLNVKNIICVGFDFEELKPLKEKVKIVFFDNYKQQAYKIIQKRKENVI